MDILCGSTSSSSSDGYRHDVFVSFGADTRYGFTDFLHQALMDAGMYSIFLSNEETGTGEGLKPELRSAIKASRASIIVLSKKFAYSSRCLDELVLILEERMNSNHIVIPVFFHSAHIWNPESSFLVAMTEHWNKSHELGEKIEGWIQALSEVAKFEGMEVEGRVEREVIDEIVEDICCKIPKWFDMPKPPPIGIEDSIKIVNSWLEDASSHKPDILTILGMGGIGKTTLAKYVYGSHFHEFEKSSFIGCVSYRYGEKEIGLLGLLKQLYQDISRRLSVQFDDDVSEYNIQIQKVLANQKVFLVLDGIDSKYQLDALIGSKVFCPGSKIIITTNNASLTKTCDLFKTDHKHVTHITHMLRGLNETCSQKLLCYHAFGEDQPNQGYENVSNRILKYCQGHPLALETFGNYLYNRDVAYWMYHIKALEEEKDLKINRLLRKEFDSLPSEKEKGLFLHIACFFVGVDIYLIKMVLNACGFDTVSGIKTLEERCLISIGQNNQLEMHPLLQQLGRFIVHQESNYSPWEQTQLWCHEESIRLLKHKNGKEKLLGLSLDMRMVENKKLQKTFRLEPDALSKMNNLVLLQLNYVQLIHGSSINFPKQLRWLCVHGFPSKSMPIDQPIKHPVALDMSHSSIESFGDSSNSNPPKKMQKLSYGWHSKGEKLFGSLKILNLSFCEKLHDLGGFEQLPALERLMAPNCTSLVHISESIRLCSELDHIDLSYCNNLPEIPSSTAMLKKLKTLNLDGCNHLSIS